MEIHEILALQSVSGIGNKALIGVMTHVRKCGYLKITQLTESDITDNKSLKRFSKILIECISDGSLEEKLELSKEKYTLFVEAGISVVSFLDDLYPKLLTEIKDPPALLFCKGNTALLAETGVVAVVGTRDPTDRGELITQRTVEFLVSEGHVVVSGLALGIDSLAHMATVESDGRAIAVLVDVKTIQPSVNQSLAERILDTGGLLVSENPPGTKVIPALFAKRDRIQAGLSQAVFAIETSKDGGTMHAVNAAIKLERPIYVPNPTSAGYKDFSAKQISGTQYLIQSEDAEQYTKEDYPEIANILRLASVKVNNA